MYIQEVLNSPRQIEIFYLQVQMYTKVYCKTYAYLLNNQITVIIKIGMFKVMFNILPDN